MNKEYTENLAMKTLHGHRIAPVTSSFRANDAGIELSKSGVGALAIIEKVIKEKVIPRLDIQDKVEVSHKIQEDWGALMGNASHNFIGLNYLIGAYLVIGVRENTQEVFAFLEEQPKVIQIEALECSLTFFFKTSNGYNFGIAPSRILLKFLMKLSKSTDCQIASLADDVHKELSSHLYS